MRVVLCCPEGIVGDALVALVGLDPDFALVGRASQLAAARAAAVESSADVLLVHQDALQRGDAERLSRGPKRARAKAILLGQAGSAGPKPAGIHAVLPLSASADELFKAMRETDGQRRGSRSVREAVSPYAASSLTRRESQVAQFVARGHSNRSIATAFGLQEQTVKNLVSAIMKKLDCDNRVQLALQLSHGPSGMAES